MQQTETFYCKKCTFLITKETFRQKSRIKGKIPYFPPESNIHTYELLVEKSTFTTGGDCSLFYLCLVCVSYIDGTTGGAYYAH